MASVRVAISEVKDGTMYEPANHRDATVIKNRSQWLAAQGIALADATRLFITYDRDDFCQYRIVDATNKREGMEDGHVAPADALVTTTPGVALFLPIADCVAATFFDATTGVLMLAHLGRHSLEQQGGIKCVAFLEKHFGVDPKNLKVWLSPAPNKDAYPIYKLNNMGMKEAVFAQLKEAGIQQENITDNPADTVTDDRYYSYSEFLKGKKPTEGRYVMVAQITV